MGWATFTWNWFTGKVILYFDGEEATPFWVSRSGQDEIEKSPGEGVDSSIAAGSSRSDTGSFVLGARQQAYGGNFSPQTLFVVIWRKLEYGIR
eukprot:jgi/Picre1/30215/NNA_005583.t1